MMKIKNCFLRCHKYMYLFPVFVFLLILNGCDKSIPNSYVNKYDPESKYYIGNNPSNLSVVTLGREKIKINWIGKSNYIDGYIIEKKDSISQIVKRIIKSRTEATSLEDTLNIFNTYKYRIKTNTASNLSSYCDSVKIKYSPFTQKISNTSAGIRDYKFNPDYTMAIITNSGKVNIYEVTDPYNLPAGLKLVGQMNGLQTSWNISFSTDNKYLAGNTTSGEVVFYYNIGTGVYTELRRSSVVTSTSAIMGNDGSSLCNLKSSVDGAYLEKWNLLTKKSALYSIQVYSYTINKMFFSKDNRYLIILHTKENNNTFQSFIEVYDYNTMQSYMKINGYIDTYTFMDDGKLFVYKDTKANKICFWNLGSKSLIQEWNTGSTSFPSGFNFILNGEFLIDNPSPYVFRLWKMNKLLPEGMVLSYKFPAFDYSHLITMQNGTMLYYGDAKLSAFTFKDDWKIIK